MKSVKQLRRVLAFVLCLTMVFADSSVLSATAIEHADVANAVTTTVAEPEAETAEVAQPAGEETHEAKEPLVAEAEEVPGTADDAKVDAADEADATDGEEVAGAAEEEEKVDAAAEEQADEATPEENEDAEEETEEEDQETTYTATVGETTVTVVVPAGAFTEKVTLQVSEVAISEELQAELDAKANEEQKAIETATAYDIKFVNAEGVEVEPAKAVQVTIATPEVNTGDDASVYHVDEETATVEDMGAATTTEGDVAFDTNHFSTYVIVSKTDNLNVRIHHVFRNTKTNNYEELFTTDDRIMNAGGQINDYNKANKDYWDVKVYQKKNGDNFSDELSTESKIEAVTNVRTNEFTGFEIWVVYTQKNTTTYEAPVTFWDYQVKPNNKTTYYIYQYTVKSAGKEYAHFLDYIVQGTNTVWEGNNRYEIVSGPVRICDTNREALKQQISKTPNKVKKNYDDKIVNGSGFGYSVNYIDNYRYDNDAYYDANKYYLTIGKSKQDPQNQNFDENSYLGGQKSDNDEIKKKDINYYISDGIKTNIVSGLKKNENGQYTDVLFNYNQPGIFTLNETNGKQVYQNRYTLKFDRTGDTYKLSKVHDNEKNKDYDAGSSFFPLDGIDGAIEADESNKPESAAGSSVTHNDFFGMRYDVTFQIGDYNGPLEYKFEGDDDLWVLLDGEVVIDLGGIHKAVKSGTLQSNYYVDLWPFLGGKENCDRAAQHTLTVLYLERGGYDSNCNMDFTIPYAGIINYSRPIGDLDFTKVDEDGNPVAGALFELKAENGGVRTAYSGEDGNVHFGGLYVGNYTLTEKEPPEGYQASEETWTVTVEPTGDTTAVATMKNGSKETVTQIVNKKKEELPPPEITFDSKKTVAEKSYKDRTYTITLEANSTTKPTSTTVTSSVAVDVMMLLDVSGSMDNGTEYNLPQAFSSLKKSYTKNGSLRWKTHYKNKLDNYDDYFVLYEGAYYKVSYEDEDYSLGVWQDTYSYTYYANLGGDNWLIVEDGTMLYTAKETRLGALKASAAQFLTSISQKSPTSNVGIVTFSAEDEDWGIEGHATLRRLTEIGTNPQAAISSLDDMEAFGGTSPELALQDALNAFNAKGISTDGRKKVVVLFTDGEPTGTHDYPRYGNVEDWDSKENSEEKRDLLDAQGVTIYTIGFALSDAAKNWLSTEIATSANHALTADTQDELIKAFETVSNTITNNTDISNATVVDVIDPRFELVAGEEARLRNELKEGQELTVSVNNDGTTTIKWTGQTLPYEGKWTKTINIKAKDDFLGGNKIPTNVAPESGITIGEGEELKPFPQEPTVNVKLLDLTGTTEDETVFVGDLIQASGLDQHLAGAIKVNGTPLVQNLTFDKDGKCEVPYSYGTTDQVGTITFTKKAEGTGASYTDHNATVASANAPVETYTVTATYKALTATERDAKLPTTEGVTITAPVGAAVDSVSANAIHYVYVVEGKITIKKTLSNWDVKKASYGDPVFTYRITNTTSGKVYYKTVRLSDVDKGLFYSTVTTELKGLPRGNYEVKELDTMGFTCRNSSIGGNAKNMKTYDDKTLVSFTFTISDSNEGVVVYNTANATYDNLFTHSDEDTDTDVVKNTFVIGETIKEDRNVDNVRTEALKVEE